MGLHKTLWRVGIARMAAAEIVARGSLDDVPVAWLPAGPPLTFLADPFGLWRDGMLHLFAEAFDYRDRIGRIDVLRFDRDLALIDRRPCLIEPWHLSYPQVFEHGGETWMLPEAFRSGTLTLYRAVDFPVRWEKAAGFDLDGPAVDATPLFHDGRWWLFYAASWGKAARQSHLHVAYADRLQGPWTLHPLNPVRIDRASARPGGTAMILNGRPVLPVQDCTHGYGGALRLLTITTLTPDAFAAEVGAPMTAPASAAPFTDGLHTLSACGPVTLVDAKRRFLSPAGLLADIRRGWARGR